MGNNDITKARHAPTPEVELAPGSDIDSPSLSLPEQVKVTPSTSNAYCHQRGDGECGMGSTLPRCSPLVAEEGRYLRDRIVHEALRGRRNTCAIHRHVHLSRSPDLLPHVLWRRCLDPVLSFDTSSNLRLL